MQLSLKKTERKETQVLVEVTLVKLNITKVIGPANEMLTIAFCK